jgi:hypothetical protein
MRMKGNAKGGGKAKKINTTLAARMVGTRALNVFFESCQEYHPQGGILGKILGRR